MTNTNNLTVKQYDNSTWAGMFHNAGTNLLASSDRNYSTARTTELVAVGSDLIFGSNKDGILHQVSDYHYEVATVDLVGALFCHSLGYIFDAVS
jgi:hypothetical protein